MKTIRIPNIDFAVLPLCLECANLGVKNTEGEAIELLDAFVAAGGNFLDTARVFSNWVSGELNRSERIIGDWLATCFQKRISRRSIIRRSMTLWMCPRKIISPQQALVKPAESARAYRADSSINSVKIYGANTGGYWSIRDAQERFWRNIVGGLATTRFHRPLAGLGFWMWLVGASWQDAL
ncbi:MAG: aldo/keto reductase [Candidatus Latescibacterota bacterium]|nr:aldo/keto reductase [Candidatus Latescibacterota bacterium]